MRARSPPVARAPFTGRGVHAASILVSFAAMTLFDEIGGDRLRAVLSDFYDRVFADTMIGFLFWEKDKALLIQREWEFTARLLGADVPYTGRPIQKAHAHSPILGGHFARRLKILQDMMEKHAVPESVRTAWVEHTLALRPQVTRDSSAECDHEKNAARLAAVGEGPPKE